MKFINLNHTDLKVSPVCLGTVNFGSSLDRITSKEQMKQFIELGGNFLDTGHVYGNWIAGEKSRSEKIIGEWINENRFRDQLILSTKGGHPDLDKFHISRVTVDDINKDLNESLRCLKTDYIDLYFLHRDNVNVPVEEIIDTLEEAKKQGKIRYYGCSNWTLPRIKVAQEYAKRKEIDGFVCNQALLSLADINVDRIEDKTMVVIDSESYEYHTKSNMNLMAYTAIAKGYFTHRFQGRQLSEGEKALYNNLSNDIIYKKLVELSKETNLSIFDLSLQYVMTHNFPSIPLVSVSNKKQLEETMVGASKIISHDIIYELTQLKKFNIF